MTSALWRNLERHLRAGDLAEAAVALKKLDASWADLDPSYLDDHRVMLRALARDIQLDLGTSIRHCRDARRGFRRVGQKVGAAVRGLYQDEPQAWPKAPAEADETDVRRLRALLNAAAALLQALGGDAEEARLTSRTAMTQMSSVDGEPLVEHMLRLAETATLASERGLVVSATRPKDGTDAGQWRSLSVGVTPSGNDELSDTARYRRRLQVAHDGTWFSLDGGEPVHLGNRRTLIRLLQTLVRARMRHPGEQVTRDEIMHEVWPEERIIERAAYNRIRVAVATLRNLGLRTVLRTSEEGYLLSSSLRIEYVRPAPDSREAPLSSSSIYLG